MALFDRLEYSPLGASRGVTPTGTPASLPRALTPAGGYPVSAGYDGSTATAAWPLGQTGEPVSADDSMTYSPWFRAVWILASTIAKTPLHVYRIDRTEQGEKREIDVAHRAEYCLSTQFNDEETAFNAKLRMAMFAVMEGQAIGAYFDDNPNEVYPFQPGECWPQRIKGKLWYLVDVYGDLFEQKPRVDRVRRLRPEQVVHVRGPAPDGLIGLAVRWYARNALREGLNGNKVRVGRSRNQGRPMIALVTDQALLDTAVIKTQRDWVNRHEGFDGANLPAVLDRGLKPLAIPYAADQQYETELAALPLQDVANFTGVPASFLGAKATTDSLEHDDIALTRYGVGFWYHAFIDAFAEKVLTDRQRKGQTHAVDFDRATVEWQDAKTRAEMVRTYLAGAPVADINEIRSKLGMPPRPEPEAKKLLVPLNVGDNGSQNKNPNPNDPQPGRPARNGKPSRSGAAGGEVESDLAPLVEHNVRRMLKWVTGDARRRSTSAKAFMTFLEGMVTENVTRFDAEWEVLKAAGAGKVELLQRVRREFELLADKVPESSLRAEVDALCQEIEIKWPREVTHESVG